MDTDASLLVIDLDGFDEKFHRRPRRLVAVCARQDGKDVVELVL